MVSLKLQQFILREECAWPPEKMMSTKVLLNFDIGDHGLSKEELNVIFGKKSTRTLGRSASTCHATALQNLKRDEYWKVGDLIQRKVCLPYYNAS